MIEKLTPNVCFSVELKTKVGYVLQKIAGVSLQQLYNKRIIQSKTNTAHSLLLQFFI